MEIVVKEKGTTIDDDRERWSELQANFELFA